MLAVAVLVFGPAFGQDGLGQGEQEQCSQSSGSKHSLSPCSLYEDIAELVEAAAGARRRCASLMHDDTRTTLAGWRDRHHESDVRG
jgi:hypothetical protein